MRIKTVIIAAFLLAVVAAEDSWSWNKEETPLVTDGDDIRRSDESAEKKSDPTPEPQKPEGEGRHIYSEQEIYSNDTSIDEVVNTILDSTRQGRNLDGYDEVYTDPSVQEALQRGDDAEARNLIREKLCSLGLMQCDDTQEKRPFGPPPGYYHGAPPRGPYGPPRPMPPPGKYGPGPGINTFGPPPSKFGPPSSSNHFGPPPSNQFGPPPSNQFGPPPPPPGPGKYGPPRKVGFEGPSNRPFPAPVYPGPSFANSDFEFTKPPPGAIIYGSKPPGPVVSEPEPPYAFEGFGEKIHHQSSSFGELSHDQFGSASNQFGPGKPTIVVNAQGGAAGAANGGVNTPVTPLQQHVHHHFHHVEGGDKIPNVPVPIATGNGIGGDFASISGSSGYDLKPQPSSAFSAGFNAASAGSSLLSSNFNGINSGKGPGSGGLYTSIKPVSESGFNPSLNPGLGSFGSGAPLSGSLGSSGFNGGSFGSSNSGSFNSGSFGSSNSGGFNGGGFSQPNAGGFNGGFGNGASGSFHSSNPDYFKKELNVNGPSGSNGIYNPASQFNSQYSQFNNGEFPQGFETARQGSFDCVCVPYQQCPAADRIGRKDDLILPLDPRNLGKDIEALSDEVAANTTRSDVKNAEGDQQSESKPAESKKSKREVSEAQEKVSEDAADNAADVQGRQAFYGGKPQQCRPDQVCCRRPLGAPQQQQQLGRCGTRNANGITGRIKNPVYIDGDSEFGEYPWQAAILKKDPKESVYVCGGTIIDGQHIITAAHCIKTFSGFDLRVRLGEWDVNHDVEFFPYVERDVISVHVHPEYYAGTLDNDLAILKLDRPIDFSKSPHISPACLPDKFSDFTGQRCWTTGWGKDAFGSFGKYQNILKEVDVPILSNQQCQAQLRQTRLGFNYVLNPGFVCAGGEEGKDACKGDGGGPMVCERNGVWNVVGVVSWGIGCGQVNVPGVYVRVSHYLDWIHQITRNF